MTKFKKVTTWAQVESDPRVDNAYWEMGNLESGKRDYWVELKEGYISTHMDCGIIHERTKRQCIDLLNTTVVKVAK